MKNERRNKRLYKTISCVIVFFICVFAGVGLALTPQNKVKADTPSTYYFDIDTSQQNYLTIILYVLDVANLQESTCNAYLYSSSFSPPYSTSTYVKNIEFLRYSPLDYDDYDAYKYDYQYPNISTATPVMLYLNTGGTIGFDNNVKVSYDLFIPYQPTFKKYFDDGYNNGYDDGVQDTTENLNEYWNNYISDTYINTSGSGYQEIYQRGRNDGINANVGTQNWFITAFGAVDSFLNIHIFPNITFGVLLGIPFVISVAWFIIRMFRGGGGD